MQHLSLRDDIQFSLMVTSISHGMDGVAAYHVFCRVNRKKVIFIQLAVFLFLKNSKAFETAEAKKHEG